jgi:hypothetical protein
VNLALIGLLRGQPWQSSIARPLAFCIETPRSTQTVGSNDGRLHGGGLALKTVLATSSARNTLVIVTVWAAEPDAIRGLAVKRVVAVAAKRAVAMLQQGHVNRSIRIAESGDLAASGKRLVSGTQRPRKPHRQPLLRQSEANSAQKGAKPEDETPSEPEPGASILVRSSQFPGLASASSGSSARLPVVDSLGRVLFEAGRRDEHSRAAEQAPIAPAPALAPSPGHAASTTDSLASFQAAMASGKGVSHVDDAALASFWRAIPDSPLDTAKARSEHHHRARLDHRYRWDTLARSDVASHSSLPPSMVSETKSGRASPVQLRAGAVLGGGAGAGAGYQRRVAVPSLALGRAGAGTGDADPASFADGSSRHSGWSHSHSARPNPPRAARRALVASGRAAVARHGHQFAPTTERAHRPRRALQPLPTELALSASTIESYRARGRLPAAPSSSTHSRVEVLAKRELRIHPAGYNEPSSQTRTSRADDSVDLWQSSDAVQGWATQQQHGGGGVPRPAPSSSRNGALGVVLGEAEPYPQWRMTPGGALKTTLIDSSCVMWPHHGS